MQELDTANVRKGASANKPTQAQQDVAGVWLTDGLVR
jgi:hypothetical protein